MKHLLVTLLVALTAACHVEPTPSPSPEAVPSSRIIMGARSSPQGAGYLAINEAGVQSVVYVAPGQVAGNPGSGPGAVDASAGGGGGGGSTTTYVGSYYSFPFPDAGYQFAQATNGTYGGALFANDGTQWRPSLDSYLGYVPPTVDAGSWTHMGASSSPAATLIDEPGGLLATFTNDSDGFYLAGVTLSSQFQIDIDFQVVWPVFGTGNGLFGLFFTATTGSPSASTPGKRFSIYNNSNSNLVLQVQQFGSGYGGGAGSVSYSNSLQTYGNNVSHHLRVTADSSGNMNYLYCPNRQDCFQAYSESRNTLVTVGAVAIITQGASYAATARVLSFHVCNGAVCP